ncbi:MAG: PAS domain S-box protein [Desulfovibrio sp.]|nr:MAG: PAS domain S-box protein [Desulfovibrio sp.]
MRTSTQDVIMSHSFNDSQFLLHSMDHCPVGIIITSRTEHTQMLCNAKCREILDLRVELSNKSNIIEILTQLHSIDVHGHPIDINELPILKCLEEKMDCDLTFTISPNNTKKIILMRSSPIADNNEVTGSVSTVEDITDSFLLQNNLESATLRLKNLWQLTKGDSPSIKQVCDVTLEAIAEITKSKYGFYGFMSEDDKDMIIHSWTGETMKGCTIMDKPFIYPIEKAGLWAESVRQRRPLVVNDYLSSDLPKRGFPDGHVQLESLMVIPHFRDGKIHSVAAVANKDFGYDDDDVTRIQGFLGDVQAIIKRVEAETLLKKSEEKYRSLVELMNEGVLVLDSENIVTFVNKKICKILGQEFSEIVGNAFTNFTHASSKEFFLDQQLLRRNSISDPYEMTLVNRAGDEVFVLASPTPLLDDDGQYKGSYEIITDISHIKKIEMQLLQSKKMETIGLLAAGIAHEINTPLQFIIGNTSFIKETTDKLAGLARSMKNIFAGNSFSSPLETLQTLEEMIDELDIEFIAEESPAAINDSIEGLDRISSIVHSVKQFAHPSTDDLKPININEEITNAINISRNEWKHNAEVITQLDTNLPKTLCITSDFSQMVLNLIVNASHSLQNKFIGPEEKGTITITTFYDDHFAGILVADNGLGIPHDIQEKVFSPFFTTKEVGKGTGMGLAIVLKIVEKHRGKIWFESTEGEGTTFYVQLPILSPA